LSNNPEAIVIGAGPAGLATAARLKAAGVAPIILEKSDVVGSTWRRHYDRLRLHTHRAHSSLPGLPMPATYGRYPSRGQFVEYLESYAARFALAPVFDAPVGAVRREGRRWRVEAGDHSAAAPIVVVATGWADYPYSPDWPGMAEFAGSILHSSLYRNPAPYAGKRVLVIGLGNSGGEIALDLAEAGVDVTIAVRGPVRILPRDLLGVSIVTWSILQRRLPAPVCDLLSAPLIRLAVGSLEKLGLRTAAKGPRRMVEEDRRAPLLDVGTVAKIREGAVRVRGGVESFAANGVMFVQTGFEPFDAVILATGFRPDLRALLPDAKGVLDETGGPLVSDRATAEPGLYFVGAFPSATGQLREIGIGATRIAEDAGRFLRKEQTTRNC
jgi:cation diffusion facilitator CzcD-associated flavoprotein CzcO